MFHPHMLDSFASSEKCHKMSQIQPMTIAQPIRYEVAEFLARGVSISAVAKCYGINRRTIRRWLADDPIFKDTIEEIRLDRLDRLRERLDRIAFSGDLGSAVTLRAILEQLRALEPDVWDPTYRRRRLEAELADKFNPRIQWQNFMDERDKRIHEENLRRAEEDRAAEEDDLEEMEFLEAAAQDLLRRRRLAALEVAKQADDYDSG
jgi:hypothetical protein